MYVELKPRNHDQRSRSAKLGEPDDAAGILQTRGESLDVAYVERWVGALGLDAYWRELKKR